MTPETFSLTPFNLKKDKVIFKGEEYAIQEINHSKQTFGLDLRTENDEQKEITHIHFSLVKYVKG